MGSIVVKGSTSGEVTINAPAVAGSTSISLPTVTGGSFVVSNSSGNVGIGTSSPSSTIDIQNTTQKTSLTGTSYSVLNLKSTTNTGDYAGITFQSSAGYPGSIIAYQQTASGGQLALGITNNYGLGITAEAMRIDASGRVTMPLQPAFWAYSTVTAATWTATNIIFDAAPVNRGSCYNTTNGRFTAPVAGFYVFGAMIQNQSSTAYMEIEFRVNGAKAYDTQVGQQNGYKVPLVAAYQLSAGDYVNIGVVNGTAYGDYTSFYGYLVG